VYNVVVVDDEPLVLYGVSAILNSRRDRFRIIKTFQDSKSALKYCVENPPDLLLTDINMPGMSGLVLIEELKPQYPEMKIVVLSCHEEFKLVHEAFRLGANEYLLKHNLEKNSFFDILDSLLPKKRCTENIAEEKFEPDTFSAGPGILGVIGFKQEYSANLECIPWAPDREIIRQIIRSNLNEQSGDLCFNGPWDEILLFISDETNSILDGVLQVQKKFEKIRALLSGYLNRKVFIALEKVTEEEGKTTYANALHILEQKFYHADSCLLFSKNTTVSSIKKFHLIFPLMGKNRLQQWKTALAAYLEKGETLSLCPSIIRSEVSYAFHHLLNELEELNSSNQAVLYNFKTKNLYEMISVIDDREILQQWVGQKLEDIYLSLRTFRESQTLSGSVKEYVKAHFSGSISLSDMATLFNVSSSYLSTIFKLETGISYIKFVNRIRIGHACDLLANTDLTVKEITYRTGYENPNYFSRLFKKQMGLTVSDYRKKIIDSESGLYKQESER
jgi:two-component system response regulator YesN